MPVELTDHEAKLVTGLLFHQFGKVLIPPAAAPLVAGLMEKLPDIEPPTAPLLKEGES